MNIRDKLSNIQSKFKAKKSRFNNFGKYNFRSAEDILEALKPYNIEYNVYFTVDEIWLGDGVMQSTASIVCNESGGNVDASAIVGVDFDQKGMQMPQKFGSASSYGKKYALGNLFLIDDTADSDATNNHGKAPRAQKETLTSKKDPAFAKAKDYVRAGGKIEAIKAKYALSKEIEAELTTL